MSESRGLTAMWVCDLRFHLLRCVYILPFILCKSYRSVGTTLDAGYPQVLLG